jgi:hypothetical protein
MVKPPNKFWKNYSFSAIKYLADLSYRMNRGRRTHLPLACRSLFFLGNGFAETGGNNMKRIAWMVLFLSLATQIYAAVPPLINYSGKLTDKTGNLIVDGEYDMIFTLYDAITGGNQVWQESHAATGQLICVRAGAFNMILGDTAQGGIVLPTFSKPYFLELSFKRHSDPTYETFPRQQLLSTPYSMRAEIANQVANDCITSEKIADKSISTCDIADNTITAAKIANSTITASKITTTAGQRINGSNIENGTLTSSNITTSTTAGQRIQTVNIEDSAITNAKIANGAVDTPAKVPVAPAVYFTSSPQNNPKIDCGSGTTNDSGDYSVSFHVVFSSPPIVVVSRNWTGTATQFANTNSVTTTGFSVATFNGTYKAGPIGFNWIAIGY